MKRRLTLQVNDEILNTLKTEGTENWLKTNVQKYNPNITVKPIKYSGKRPFKPQVTSETYEALSKIPGNSNSVRIQNLYYNLKEQNRRTNNRKEILKKLFPNHPYLKK